jgi:SAM-dependent methyltransferase
LPVFYDVLSICDPTTFRNLSRAGIVACEALLGNRNLQFPANNGRIRRMSTRYDQIAYPAHSHPQAHPDRLAAMATLFGAPAPPIASARVLELGCGDGLDLIAIAYAWPNTTCVGVDLSRKSIERGQELVNELKLSNIELIAGDFREFEHKGSFDYIIAHGLYSWVPHEIADAALALAARMLSEQGLAYFSYDVYPGAHLKLIAREFMRLGIGFEKPPLESATLARQALQALEACASHEHWRRIYANERERISKIADAGLIHDDLGEQCRAVTFVEFVEHAKSRGLHFVCEADPVDAFPANLTPQASALIQRLSGSERIRAEQVGDFVRGRRFRQSILSRAPVKIESPINANHLSTLHFAAHLKCEPSSGSAMVFRGPGSASATVDHPSAVGALKALASIWPAAMRFDELRRRAAQSAKLADDEQHAAAIAQTLTRAAGARLVEIYAEHPRAATTLSDQPAASALARIQSTRGDMVTSLTGRTVNLKGDAARLLLQLLDGMRGIPEITAEMSRRLNQPKLSAADLEARIRELIDLRLILPPTR